MCVVLGKMLLWSWEDFDGTKGPVVKTRHLSKEDLSGALRKAYLSYYTSPAVILTNLSKVRSLSDAKRVFRGIRSVFSRVFYYDK